MHAQLFFFAGASTVFGCSCSCALFFTHSRVFVCAALAILQRHCTTPLEPTMSQLFARCLGLQLMPAVPATLPSSRSYFTALHPPRAPPSFGHARSTVLKRAKCCSSTLCPTVSRMTTPHAKTTRRISSPTRNLPRNGQCRTRRRVSRASMCSSMPHSGEA